MMAHTKGPWVCHGVTVEDCDKGSLAFIVEAEGGMVASRANARLIEAAPALLEALEALFADYKMLADSGDAGNWSLEELEVGKQAIAALSLAKGEAA